MQIINLIQLFNQSIFTDSYLESNAKLYKVYDFIQNAEFFLLQVSKFSYTSVEILNGLDTKI